MSTIESSSTALDLAYTKKIFSVRMDSPLFIGLYMMASNRGIYRLTVTDSRRQVRGILSGIQILETFMGRRGVGIKRRVGKDFESLFQQPIKLFINEYLHKLSCTLPLHGLLSYIVENNVGHIVLVDQLNTLRGVVTERCIIDRLEVENFGIKVSDIMTSKIYTVNPVHTIVDVIDIMSAHRIRRVPILDKEKVIGIVTATDILRHLMRSEFHIEAILSKNDIKQFLMSSIGDIEFSQPSSIHPDNDLGVLLKQLKETEYTGFPVIKDGKLMGIISSRDMVIKTPKLLGIDSFAELISLNKK